jgi:hypothetical protein
MSSHSNPHGIALNLAAARFGIPIVLITHGMPIRPLAKLNYALAIHECEASSGVYQDAGCRMDHVIIKSRKREHESMRIPVPSEGTVESRRVRALREAVHRALSPRARARRL